MEREQKTRRQVLHVLGSAAVTALAGCGGRAAWVSVPRDREATDAQAGAPSLASGGAGDGGNGVSGGRGGTAASGGSAGIHERGGVTGSDAAGAAGMAGAPPGTCVVRPEQTQGPYFVDERLNRVDVRSDPSSGAVKDGVPLRVVLRVHRLDASGCTPLAGAMVDLWQCDAEGVYSDVLDSAGRFDTRGQQFLRGYQLTNAAGLVEFLSIYPGFYEGRTVHLHFGIRTDPGAASGFQFVSQLYFDQATTDRVLSRPPYAARGPASVTNTADGIFLNGGSELMLALSETAEGYRGELDLALRIA